MDITTITRNEKIDAIADAFYKCNQPERGNLFISSSDLLSDDDVDYYLVVARDFAGNMITKKLTSQRTLLKMFHTSIDRTSYE